MITGLPDAAPGIGELGALDGQLDAERVLQRDRGIADDPGIALRRAEVEWIPNVTLYTGYVYQGQNRSNDFDLGLSAPLPLWNRNQGNIRAAKADLGAAVAEVGRVENGLSERLATAFRGYAGAHARAERYRTELIPRARQAAELLSKAFEQGQFDYLKVLQAQRGVAEASLEYNRSLGEAWKGAADLSGLLLEELWPGPPPNPTPEASPPPRPVPDVRPKP